MNAHPPAPVSSPIRFCEWRQSRYLGFAAAFALAGLLPVPAQHAHPAPPQSHLSSRTVQPADELSSRLATAAAARKTGDPASITTANTLLVASALDEMGALRAAQGAYPQAIELLRDSLRLESSPATRLTLATVEAQAGQYDDAIRLAETIHREEPQNIQADRILSSSLMQQGKYAEALVPLERVARVDDRVETQYALANCLLQTKRPEDKLRAQAVFRKIEAEHGDSGSIHVLIGRSYRDSGDVPGAVGEFERALQIDPRTPHAHYFLGLARLNLNEWRPTPEAQAEIKKEAELYPQDYLANYMTGFLASEERNYDAAAPYLRTAAALDPTSPDPHLFLGLNAYAESNLPVAEAELRKAVELTGGDEARANYQIRRAYVDLGRILAKSGHQDESEQFLAKARDLQNKTMEQSQQDIASMAGASANPAAVLSLKSAAAPSGLTPGTDETATLDAAHLHGATKLTEAQQNELKTREQQLRAVLALAYNDLGTAAAVGGNFPAAASLYRKGEEWDASLPGLEKNLGQSEFRAGNFEAAISPLTQALLQQPENHGLRAMLGIAYFDLYRFAEAAHTFAPLGQPGMLDDQVGYAWAASLARSGDTAKATQVLTAYASQPRPAEVQVLIGQVWTALGDYPRAVAALQGVLAANSAAPRAHLALGLAYIHWEHWPEAAHEFQAELAQNAGDPDATYHLGYVDLQQGKVGDAEQLFQTVVTTHPGYANAQYQLGKILLDRGQIATAITHLQAAERSSPSTDYIHYQLQAAYRKASRDADAEKELAIYKQLKADSRQQAADRVAVH